MAESCRRFSPTIGLEPDEEPECLVLDVGGVAGLFGGEEVLARRVAEWFTRRGRRVAVTVADTLGAAWAAAHEAPARSPSSRAPRDRGAPVARESRPLVLLPPGHGLAPLVDLPVAALRLDAGILAQLESLGIRTIGQAARLPRGELAERFGGMVLRRLDQAAGRLAEPIPAATPPEAWIARWSTEHPTAQLDALRSVLRDLFARLARQLRRAGRVAEQLQCRLRCVPGRCSSHSMDAVAAAVGGDGIVSLGVGLFEPTAHPSRWFELVDLQLERVRLPGPVEAIEVEVVRTSAACDRQGELPLDGPARPPEPARELARLIERLGARLGYHAVLRARLLGDAQPELACRYESWIGCRRGPRPRGRPGHTGSSPPSGSVAPWPIRPLCLLPRPVAIVAVQPDAHAPPTEFHDAARRQRIVQCWGPERIETGWWRGRSVGRDYYRVETGAGGHYWLFRRLRDGRWFLHGWFD